MKQKTKQTALTLRKLLARTLCLTLLAVTSSVKVSGAGHRTGSGGAGDIRACHEVPRIGPTSFLDSKISLNQDTKRLGDVIEMLQAKLHLPISFVDHEATLPVTLKLDGVSVLKLLQNLIASQSIGYQCLVADGHVLVIPEEPRLSLVISGVEAEDLPRFPAARRLVEHLAVLDEFKHMGVFGGGLLETSLFTERVSLSKSAMVLEHLVELLGDDPGAFFVIERASTGVEYLSVRLHRCGRG